MERLITDSFSPNSENTYISSSVEPNATNATFVVPDVGCVMLAENCESVGEKTRMLSVEASKMRFEDSDHTNQCMDATTSGGSDITRVTSNDRVSRMLSLDGRTVAMNAPFGLGSD